MDVTTGEPLFASADKFESDCGWPSFSRPISDKLIAELPDYTHGREWVEVRSRHSDAHLGHVFTDGSKEHGGLRYCINSASLQFVPEGRNEAEGYGHLLHLISEISGYGYSSRLNFARAMTGITITAMMFAV